MKKILTTLVIALVLTACSAESDTKEPSSYFGTEMRLSGDVYTREINFDPETIEGLEDILDGSSNLVKYIKAGNLNLTISDNGLGGSGEVKKGKLSYSIGKPNEDYLEPIKNVFDELLSGAGSLPGGVVLPDYSVSSDTAQAVPLYLIIEDDPTYFSITRERITSTSTSSYTSMTFKITAETVSHLYVDEGVRITVSPFTYETTYTDLTDDELPAEFPEDIPIKLTTGSINLNLQEGWNAIHSTLTLTLKISLLGSSEASGKLNVKLGNPSSLKWVLSGEDEFLPFP
jgi:hypothetical protein